MFTTVPSKQNRFRSIRMVPSAPCQQALVKSSSLAQQARKILADSPYSDLRAVECLSCCDDTLVLRGRVGSFYEKQIAQTLVKDIEGLDQLNNELEVVYRNRPNGNSSERQIVRKTK